MRDGIYADQGEVKQRDSVIGAHFGGSPPAQRRSSTSVGDLQRRSSVAEMSRRGSVVPAGVQRRSRLSASRLVETSRRYGADRMQELVLSDAGVAELGRRCGAGMLQKLVGQADRAAASSSRASTRRATDAVLARIHGRHSFADVVRRLVSAADAASRDSAERRRARDDATVADVVRGLVDSVAAGSNAKRPRAAAAGSDEGAKQPRHVTRGVTKRVREEEEAAAQRGAAGERQRQRMSGRGVKRRADGDAWREETAARGTQPLAIRSQRGKSARVSGE